MKVLLDLNVVLDVIQNRVSHYQDSAEVISRGRAGEIQAMLPSHAVTTLYYVLEKGTGKAKADQAVDWLLAWFQIAAADKETFLRARELALADFEDGVVASLAEHTGCDFVVTRNEADFAGSKVPAINPTALLALLTASRTRGENE